jgi:hypothetical protein
MFAVYAALCAFHDFASSLSPREWKSRISRKKKRRASGASTIFFAASINLRVNVKKNEILLSLRGHKKKLLLRDNEPS